MFNMVKLWGKLSCNNCHRSLAFRWNITLLWDTCILPDFLSSTHHALPQTTILSLFLRLTQRACIRRTTIQATVHVAQAPLEPYAAPKSVLHCMLSTEEDVTAACSLLEEVACCYQACRLGTHTPAPGCSMFTIPPPASAASDETHRTQTGSHTASHRGHPQHCQQQQQQQLRRATGGTSAQLPGVSPKRMRLPAAPASGVHAAPAGVLQSAAGDGASLAAEDGESRQLQLPLVEQCMVESVVEAAVQLQQRILHDPPCLRCGSHPPPHVNS